MHAYSNIYPCVIGAKVCGPYEWSLILIIFLYLGGIWQGLSLRMDTKMTHGTLRLGHMHKT